MNLNHLNNQNRSYKTHSLHQFMFLIKQLILNICKTLNKNLNIQGKIDLLASLKILKQKFRINLFILLLIIILKSKKKFIRKKSLNHQKKHITSFYSKGKIKIITQDFLLKIGKQLFQIIIITKKV